MSSPMGPPPDPAPRPSYVPRRRIDAIFDQFAGSLAAGVVGYLLGLALGLIKTPAGFVAAAPVLLWALGVAFVLCLTAEGVLTYVLRTTTTANIRSRSQASAVYTELWACSPSLRGFW